jgi:tetratricopeptide (TPR) repeat protein
MDQPNVDQLYEEASKHFFGGRPDQADPILRQVVALRPQHAEAIHLQGLIATGRKDFAGSTGFFERAIQLRPDWPLAHFNLGNVQMLTGQRDAAIDSYRRSIALGIQLRDAFSNLGALLMSRGEIDQAIAVFRAGTDRFAGDAAIWLDLSGALIRHNNPQQGAAAAQRAVELAPQQPTGYCNLASALGKLEQFDDAIAAYQRALQLGPERAEVHFDLATALECKGNNAAAETHHRRATELKPEMPLFWNGLGVNLAKQARFDEAKTAYEKAISIDPNCADAHTNLALELLARGSFEQGLAEFEWRDRCTLRANVLHIDGAPRWDGSPLAGRVLLVRAEQGLGDTVQFIRYVKLLAGQPGTIFIETQGALHRLVSELVRRTDPSIRVIPRGAPLPSFDVHCPLMSLPILLGSRFDSPPVLPPYLRPPADEIAFWKSRLDALPPGLRVGLAWSGNTGNSWNSIRSIALSELWPLADSRPVQWVSLQLGSAAREVPSALPTMKLTDWTAEFHDFSDAALMANLDLIISVDTSVAHLAGALARPTWLLLSRAADWRWLREREDTPWYPNTRLFRQSKLGDWASVIQQVAAALAAFKP